MVSEIPGLDLDLSLARVHRNMSNEAFPNAIDAALVRHLPNELKDRAGELLDDPEFNWANDVSAYIDVPRGDNLVRPLCYLDVDVRLVYQALVDVVASYVEPYLVANFGDRVFSHRIASPTAHQMFGDPNEAHAEFIKAQHEEADGHAYSHCVKLDVANYYERIYQHKLLQLLERRGVPGIVSSAVSTLLRKFANGNSHGIPQGLWPSDCLGNIYLLYLDEYLAERHIHFVRYVDDYRIFCGSEREGRLILKESSRVLRDVGLSPQPLKTGIDPVDKLKPDLKPITEQFVALRQKTMHIVIRYMPGGFYDGEGVEVEEEVHQETPSALDKKDVAAFERLWTEAIDQEHKRSALLRFALAGLAAGESPTAEEYVLKSWEEFPHLAPVTIRYLQELGYKESTAELILSIVESPDSIYEYQQVWFLTYLRIAKELTAYLPRLLSIARNRNRHPLVRAEASAILAKFGSDKEGAEMQRIFADETDPRVRRALLFGFRLLPAMVRNYAFDYLPPTDWHLKRVASLVKQDVEP